MGTLREKLARWGIRVVLWLTQTYLTHDGGYELLDHNWGVVTKEWADAPSNKVSEEDLDDL